MEVKDWLGEENRLGIDIWEKKYRFQNETFDEWLDRVSGHSDEVKKLILQKKFLPGGRICAHRGIPQEVLRSTLSNCYVLPVEDSIEGIYKCCSDMARTYSLGGGVGIDISKLRPKGAIVHNSAKETTGAVSFMKTFDVVTETIGQCIAGDQFVMTTDGLKTVEEIKVGDFVYTRNGFVKVLNKIDQGTKEVFRVKSVFGNEIVTTSDHPFMSFDEKNPLKEVNLSKLKAGDGVVLLPCENMNRGYIKLDTDLEDCDESCIFHDRLKMPEQLDERLAYLIGFISGSGCIDKTYISVTCNFKDIEIIDKISMYFKELFNIDVCIKDYNTYKLLILGGVGVKSLFEKNNIGVADKLQVPDKILKSNKSVQYAYLSGLIDSSGYVSTWKKFHCITTTCQSFAKDIQLLLNLCGIISKIVVKKIKKDSCIDNFNIIISGSVNNTLVKSNLTESVKVKDFITDCEEEDFKSVFTPQSIECNVTKDAIYDYLSVGRINSLKECGKYVGAILYQDTIESIEKIGEEKVYDITLEKENMFWCNGFYVHNCGRRGALMISMDINHPDIEEFINIKANTTEITHANISVRVNAEFMDAVKKDECYKLAWPCDKRDELTFTLPINEDIEIGKLYETTTADGELAYVKMVKAKDLFTKIAENNWNYGEPGVLMWDKISSWHMMAEDPDFEYAGVNPCAEEPLPKYGACLLGSINLSEFVKDGVFDFEDFGESVKIAFKELNRIQEEGQDIHPLEGQIKVAKELRQVGLGVMGIADMLIKLKLKYDSEEAIEFCKNVSNFMLNKAFEASTELPGEKFDCVRESAFVKSNIKVPGSPHNSQILTIAPTGTISTLLNISSGIEPIFALEYNRTTKSLHGKDVTYAVHPKIVSDYMEANNITSIKDLPDYFIGSSDIDYHKRLEMQSAWQTNIDASISSTINLPETSTANDIFNIYLEAWEKGLKGVTVFRNNCKRTAILSTESAKTAIEDFPTTTAPKRPKELEADFYRVRAGGQYFFIFVGLLQSRPYEVFALPTDSIEDIPMSAKGRIVRKKKRQYTFVSNDDTLYWDNISLDSAEDKEWRSITLHVSAMLRHGMPIQSIMKIEDKCNGIITSFTKAIWKVLSKYVPAEETGDKCPECGGKIIREGGCEHCDSCGWSKCN